MVQFGCLPERKYIGTNENNVAGKLLDLSTMSYKIYMDYVDEYQVNNIYYNRNVRIM